MKNDKLNSKKLNYKSFVGPRNKYDISSALQFNLLTTLGLREHHSLLDLGCGSLRGGKLFIPYLLTGNYFGLEPEKWLVEEGIRNEIGKDQIKLKNPTFINNYNFDLSLCKRNFDFILAQSIFSHASSYQIEKCILEIKRKMKPTSIFVATYMKGSDNYKGKMWVYPECVKYTEDFLNKLVNKQNLKIKNIEWPHPNQQTWIMIYHPENEHNLPDFDDTIKLSNAMKELQFLKKRLYFLENHPYVKLGQKFMDFINRIIRIK